jgi:hypothetical protein
MYVMYSVSTDLMNTAKCVRFWKAEQLNKRPMLQLWYRYTVCTVACLHPMRGTCVQQQQHHTIKNIIDLKEKTAINII